MRGVLRTALLLGAALAAASCNSQSPELKIRSVGAAPISPSVATARAELALGNVALALEGFRKAARERPQDVDALSGLAASYERMGRSDLARKWLETALAVAPDNPELLRQFADMLDSQGNHDQAVAVRAEAAVDAQLTAPANIKALAQKSAQAPQTHASDTVTVVLPSPAPAAAYPQMAQAVEKFPVQLATRPLSDGPRLERLSLGEVALVTTKQPIWRTTAQQTLALRFVPLQPAARLLNAARSQGLAARTREHLIGRGWKGIEIGDAPVARERTLILYPPAERGRAQRLAAALGVGTVQPSFAAQVTVLLGRDIARAGVRRPT